MKFRDSAMSWWWTSLVVGLMAASASAQPCDPRWSERFYSVDLIGGVSALAEYADGPGRSIFITGGLPSDGLKPLNNIARWDGAAWQPLGQGLEGPNPGAWGNALATFDDGSGEALYVAGHFDTAGGVPASMIARWNGENWRGVGGGLSAQSPYASAVAMVVHDDGAGPALFVGGEFDHADNIAAKGIARWDGHTWTGVGGSTDGSVLAMTVADLGDGPVLVVGGWFRSAGGVSVRNIAVWDGSKWSDLGGGMDLGVETLAVYNAGAGPMLYAGGSFSEAGGVAAKCAAVWNGSAWKALGSGFSTPIGSAHVDALTVHDDGTGPALFIGGQFTVANGLKCNNVVRYSGAGWSVMNKGVSSGPEIPAEVHALMGVQRPEGPALLVGGYFELAGDRAVNTIAAWSNAQWSSMAPSEGQGVSRNIYALKTFDDGTGEALYAGGDFMKAGTATATKIARWNGAEWSAVGTGFLEQDVVALEEFDEGSGPRLFAGGNFDHAGAVKTQHIARWDGSKWTAVGPGVQNGYVWCMTTFDDGDGLDLYIGGDFDQAGQKTVSSIARWDGAAYSALGTGLDGHCVALHGFDDGAGPALYACGGFFEAGGIPSPHIARWRGGLWEAIGAEGFVGALAVYDDGSGPALYAGGNFTKIGGTPARRVARWDGAIWTEVGGGVGDDVYDMQVFDGGSGSELYVAGGFAEAGGIPARGLARWNGKSWSSVTSAITPRSVGALAVYTDQNSPALYAAGTFDNEAGPPPAAICRWGCGEAPPCYADLDGSGGLDLFDFLAFVNLFNASDPAADCDASGAYDLFDFLCFVNAYNAGC